MEWYLHKNKWCLRFLLKHEVQKKILAGRGWESGGVNKKCEQWLEWDQKLEDHFHHRRILVPRK